MFEIREYNLDDEKGIRGLFKECFGKDLSYEEWEWKYKSSPWGSSAIVALNGNEVIAHYGGIRMKFYFKGEIFDVFQPCDVMTHPKYRARIFSKRGVMVKTGEYFYKINKMDFAFGFPSERHAILGTKQLGYTKHDYVNEVTIIVDKNYVFINPFFKIYIGWDYIENKEIDTLWDKNKTLFNLTILKDSNYILWRYKQKPKNDYIPVIVRSRLSKKIKTFFIALLRDKEINILDVFNNDLEMKDLVKILKYFAKNSDAKNLKMWLHSETSFYNFIVSKECNSTKSIPYIFKIINTDITEEFLFKNYFYSMGDYDAF